MMKPAERNRLLRKSRVDLVNLIDEDRETIKRWKDMYQPSEVIEPPPFYWMIGYLGWGSAEDDVDFIDGGDYPTAQAAVDAWEIMRQNSQTRASDPDYNNDTPRLLVYRIDEVGQASTDKRWVFRPTS